MIDNQSNNLKAELPVEFGMYAIYDRVAGTYGEPFLCKREELAIRRFDYLMANSPMVANDCELVKVGDFCVDTGCINPSVKPSFVVKYDIKRSEVYKNG